MKPQQILKRFDLKKGQKVHGWRFIDLAPKRKTCNATYGFFKCISCGDIESRKISATLSGRMPKCGLCRKEDKLVIQVGDKVKNWTLIKYLREYKTGNTMGLFRCDCGREYPRTINSISSFKNSGGNYCTGCAQKYPCPYKKGDVINMWTFIAPINDYGMVKDKKGLFKCKCGKVHSRQIRYIKRSKPNIGCQTCSNKRTYANAKLKDNFNETLKGK